MQSCAISRCPYDYAERKPSEHSADQWLAPISALFALLYMVCFLHSRGETQVSLIKIGGVCDPEETLDVTDINVPAFGLSGRSLKVFRPEPTATVAARHCSLAKVEGSSSVH